MIEGEGKELNAILNFSIFDHNQNSVTTDFWSKKPSEITDSWAVLEIVAGKLNWVWKASGRRAPNIISTSTIVSDNKWHTVTLTLGCANNARKSRCGGTWEIRIDEKAGRMESVKVDVDSSTEWNTFLHESAVLFGGDIQTIPWENV